MILFAEKFESVYGKDFVVMNPSINGNTTRDAINRLHYDVLSHTPDFVYIQFGLNDCNIWKQDNGICRVPSYSFRSNLYEIIERCHQFNVNSIFLGANHPTRKNNIYDDLNIEFNNIIRAVAADISCVTLVDHELNMQDKTDYLLPDGIHLNETGHKLYFEFSKNIIKNIVI